MGGPANRRHAFRRQRSCWSGSYIAWGRWRWIRGKRNVVAGPRRATHGPAEGLRNLVGCSKKAAMRSRVVRQRGVVPEAAGCMVVACFLVRLGARRSTQAQILPAAVFCATVRADRCLPLPSHVVLDFSKQPPARLFGLATALLPCM